MSLTRAEDVALVRCLFVLVCLCGRFWCSFRGSWRAENCFGASGGGFGEEKKLGELNGPCPGLGCGFAAAVVCSG